MITEVYKRVSPYWIQPYFSSHFLSHLGSLPNLYRFYTNFMMLVYIPNVEMSKNITVLIRTTSKRVAPSTSSDDLRNQCPVLITTLSMPEEIETHLYL